MKKKMDVKVLGRRIGLCSGWDEVDVSHFVFYDFEPSDGVPLPCLDVNISYDEGFAIFYGESGDEVHERIDLIEALGRVPRNETIGMRKCEYCDGRGAYIASGGSHKCYKCSGTGQSQNWNSDA